LNSPLKLRDFSWSIYKYIKWWTGQSANAHSRTMSIWISSVWNQCCASRWFWAYTQNLRVSVKPQTLSLMGVYKCKSFLNSILYVTLHNKFEWRKVWNCRFGSAKWF
jgi:hypothetical protein